MYPRDVYCIREDVTRENMRIYNQRQATIYAKCLEINPDFYSLGLRERHTIIQMVKAKYNL